MTARALAVQYGTHVQNFSAATTIILKLLMFMCPPKWDRCCKNQSACAITRGIVLPPLVHAHMQQHAGKLHIQPVPTT